MLPNKPIQVSNGFLNLYTLPKYPLKEKATYKNACIELVALEWNSLEDVQLYDMPPIYDRMTIREYEAKSSLIQTFLKSFLELMKDGNALENHRRSIDQCTKVRSKSNINLWHVVNKVTCKGRTSWEF